MQKGRDTGMGKYMNACLPAGSCSLCHCLPLLPPSTVGLGGLSPQPCQKNQPFHVGPGHGPAFIWQPPVCFANLMVLR